MNITRTGKIARLPLHLRTELNQRLADGEPGSSLLPWLNAHWQVQEVLERHFGGKAITEQNLSEWRQGGYEEWLRHQEARDLARSYLAEAEELEEEIGDVPLTDRTTEVAALILWRLLREAEAEEGPERRKAVLEIIREIQRLRHGDHQMARTRVRTERWEREQADRRQVEEAKEQAEQRALENQLIFTRENIRVSAEAMWREYRDGLADGTLSVERATQLRAHFARHAEGLRQCGVPDLPEGFPSNSDQFAPIPTLERATARPAREDTGGNRGGEGKNAGSSGQR